MFKKIIEKIKQEPIVFMFRKMWEFKEDLRNKILLMWLLSMSSRLVWMIPAFVFGLLINEVSKGNIGENLTKIYSLLLALFTAPVVGWLLHGPSRVMERSIGYKLDRHYKSYLYNAVLALPLTWHTDHDSGDTIDRVNKATDSVFQFGRSTSMITSVFIRITGITIILIYFNFYVALLALFFLIIGIYVLLKFDKKLVPQYKEINEFDNKASAKVFDALSNVTTVKVLGIEKPILLGVKNSWWQNYGLYMKNKVLVSGNGLRAPCSLT